MATKNKLHKEKVTEMQNYIAHAEALVINEVIDHLESAYHLTSIMPDRGLETFLIGRSIRIMKNVRTAYPKF